MSSIGQALTAVVGGVIGFLVGNVSGALYGFEIGLLAGSLAFPAKAQGTFGPKLTDGQTTTASVGDAVVRGWGTFFTSGTVIYLGACQQQTHTSSQGSKGAPSQTQTTYTYTQSIGIGLCGVDVTDGVSDRTMHGVLDSMTRVWENGQLVYDIRAQLDGESDAAYAARLAAAATYADTFVLYAGDEFQLADPTIEADMGIGSTPAFRGLVYIVYPNRLLRDDQGQRHPTFKFECFIGAAGGTSSPPDVDIPAIIGSIAQTCGYDFATQIDASTMADVVIRGYAIKSVMAGRDAIAPLRSIGFFDVVESGPKLKFVKRGAAPLRTLTATDIGVYDDPTTASPAPAISVTEQQDVELPVQMRINYIAADNDYQAGQQLSPSRFDTDAVNIVDVDAPIVMTDNQAKQTIEILWNDSWQSKDTYQATVDQSNADIEPTDVLLVPMLGTVFRMRVDKANDASMIMRSLTLISDDDGAYVSTAVADPPTRVPPSVTVLSDTTLILLDIPALSETDDDSGIYAAAWGNGSGNSWSGAAVYKSLDGETFAQTAALTGSPPVGTIAVGLPAGITTTWDDENYIDVSMIKGEFESRADDAVLLGANTIAVGTYGPTTSRWEIVQFGTAVDMTDPITHLPFTRLSHLLRGRRGTEAAVGASLSGDFVVGLTMGSLFRLAVGNTGIGVQATYRAVTIGKPITSGIDQLFTPRGAALKPFSPVDLEGHFSGADLVITWIRRDRFGLPLTSGVPVGMDEATEAYEVDVLNLGTVVRTIAGLTTPTATYTGAEQTTDFGTPLTEYDVKIYQLSAVVGRGDPLIGTIP